MRAAAWLSAFCALLLGALSHAQAHPLSPASLTLREREAGVYDMRFRRAIAARTALHVVLPPYCVTERDHARADADQFETEARVVCAKPLRGAELTIAGLHEHG